MLRIGIVGLRQAGKTTLFEILTRKHGRQAPGKQEARVGVVHVPDARLGHLTAMYHPARTIYAAIEYVDTPGSVIELARSGAQAAALRDMEALAHVVRAFENPAIPHENGLIHPQRDVETVELELILSDLAVVEKRLDRVEADLKKQKNPGLEKEHSALERARQALENQQPLREVKFSAEEERILRGFTFFSLKPMLYVLNLSEQDAGRTGAAEDFAREAGLRQRAKTAVTAISGKVEAELAQLSDQEASAFLGGYGLQESAVTRLVRSSYRLLGLISFFTVGEDECRAWTLREGTTALGAAGEIHSDIAKGFIRAEVVRYEDLRDAGSLPEARSRGTLRLEGKEYVVQDGDVVHFRHSG